MTSTIACKSCGHIAYVVPGLRRCSKCGVPLTANSSAAAGTPPPPPPPRPTIPVGPPVPERMKANKVIAGRVCPGCSHTIELGDDSWNCPACFGSMHAGCHESSQSCGNVNCSAHQGDALVLMPVGKKPEPAGDMVDCKYCGEQILKTAKKCRFCGEFLDAASRARAARASRMKDEDSELQTSEIVFGILCSGIACILAIVWIIQGKPKGWKLLGIAVVTQAVFGGLRAASGH